MAEENKILITDDDASIRTTLQFILERKGYYVDTADNGNEAYDKIKYADVDVAVLDYKLPDTDGVKLSRKIKEENSEIEIIILTGKASLESAIKAVKEDVFDYLLKPVNPDELIKVIEDALRKKRLIRENRELIWELKKKNKELERLNKFKSGLISMLSHDLRSPISSLKGFNESFLQGFLGDLTEKQKNVIKTENKVIDTMMELINSLLDIQQLESGKLKMNMKSSSMVDDVVKPVLERISIVAEDKNIEINLNTEEVPDINIDPNRISQVFQNLLQNAIKFTPEGGKIDVRVKNSDLGVELSVEDCGVGIERKELNTIFEAFYTKSGFAQGRGIGLTISKEIIKAHGGMIWAESEGRNKGSKFVFVIPEDIKKTSEQ
ncbi:MAG: response regulator [Elusimicrobiota bacterium]